MVMQVFDFNRFSKHNIIGELRLQLCDVDWNHVIEEWKDLAAPAKFEVHVAFICSLFLKECGNLKQIKYNAPFLNCNFIN